MKNPVKNPLAVPLADPLQSHRDYDMPASPWCGRAAALRVYCSDGPASFELVKGDTPHSVLMDQEPRVPPHRLMELPRAPKKA